MQFAPELLKYFKMPRYLLDNMYRNSNGFFAHEINKGRDKCCKCRYTSVGKIRLIISTDMWFRMLIKTIPKQSESSYKWHQMTFCFRCDQERSAVLCIGVDASFQALLLEALEQMWADLPSSDPCILLELLLEAIVKLYDQSVWSIRDVVRVAEQVSVLEHFEWD